MKDPILEEIWAFREAHAAEFNYDLDAICADIKRFAAERRHATDSISSNLSSPLPRTEESSGA